MWQFTLFIASLGKRRFSIPELFHLITKHDKFGFLGRKINVFTYCINLCSSCHEIANMYLTQILFYRHFDLSSKSLHIGYKEDTYVTVLTEFQFWQLKISVIVVTMSKTIYSSSKYVKK